MTIFRSVNEIILSFIDYLRLVQPNLDTKPGTVARDLFVDAPSDQIASLYTELKNISSLQSFYSTSGSDLSKLASNFGVSRISGTVSTGVAVFTTNRLDNDIPINAGSTVTARNGITFKTTISVIMKSTSSNVYKATATRLRDSLELAGITDEYAVEIPVESLSVGRSGNIGRYSLISQNVAGISNITNLETFSGGNGSESDTEFRTRILSVFAGSNTGTSLGYETTIKLNPNVKDVKVVVPGDPLLIRDGTQVSTTSTGELIVSEPGGGGKIDIYVLGSNLQSAIESFVYNDQSGVNNPSNILNDIILGQQGEDTTLSSSQRRVTLLSNNVIPYQPAYSVVSVVGSSSGNNFVEKYTDSRGDTRGNFELIKDDGDFGGSVFGFDRLRWISDEIELDEESITKGLFNGIDPLSFSDVASIREVTQDILVTNEHPILSAQTRNQLTLRHTPIRTVSRIINTTTGERYTVLNQNPDGETGEINTTGKITISGSTLPITTDILQVDYIWIKKYDSEIDFDNLGDANAFRTTQDSINWDFSNLVKYERVSFVDNAGILTVTVTHNVSKVIEVVEYESETATVSNGSITLSATVDDIIDIKRNSDSAEIYNTDASDALLTGTSVVLLPSDTLAEDGDLVTVRYNSNDLFSPDGYNAGSFSGNIITLADGITADGYLLTTYVSDMNELITYTELSLLPAVKSGNNFLLNSAIVGNQVTSNILDSNGDILQNLRKSPSHLKIDASAIGSYGTLSITGTSFNKVTDALVTVTSGNGYNISLTSAVLDDLVTSTLSPYIKISKITSIERVNVDSNDEVTSVDNIYDIVNYKIMDNSLDLDIALEDSTLNRMTVTLPQTSNNEDAILVSGDVMRVTFYYVVENDSEQLFYSRNGTKYSKKVYSNIDRIAVSSGFTNNSGQISGEIVVYNANQPLNNSVYNVDYNYTAPKENERITVTYNYNDTIRDVTLSVENVRPITADVLIKEAKEKSIDISVKIVLLPQYINSEDTIKQDAIDSITSFLNANSLGTTVDSSDIINNLYTVSGIDRVRVLNFSNESSGNVSSITANSNEYLKAGTVTVEVEER